MLQPTLSQQSDAAQQSAAVQQYAAARQPRVSIITPTYREAENLPYLIERVAQVRDKHGLAIELLIVDDDSRDGTVELMASRSEDWLRLIVRTADRGLSPAVLEGMRHAKGEVLVCMDADLSHPPEAIPSMLRQLAQGADFVVGSRYTKGGTTASDWGLMRWLNSRCATLLARPLTSIRDPLAGFFALSRATYESGGNYSPIGYKIGLELLVKCRCQRVVEVPIHFDQRKFGESKLNLKQQLLYLQHLRRLYMFRYALWSQLTQFLVVGGLGTLVNLAALTLLIAAYVPVRWAIGCAILLSMTFNFILHRRYSFPIARDGAWWPQYLRFVSASSIGALLNYAVALAVLHRFPNAWPQLAASIGIAVAMGVNFIASRYLVFHAVLVREDRTGYRRAH